MLSKRQTAKRLYSLLHVLHYSLLHYSGRIDGTSTDLAIAIAIAGQNNFAPALAARNLLRDTNLVLADSVAKLNAIGLNGTATDGQIAISLVNRDKPATLRTAKIDRNILAQYEAGKIVSISYQGSALSIKFNFEKHIVERASFSFDASQLPGLSQQTLDLLGGASLFSTQSAAPSAQILADAFGRFELSFGIDVSNALAPEIFVEDSSGVTFGVTISNSNPLDFSATIGAPLIGNVSLAVQGANGLVDLTARLGLAPSSAGDGRYVIDPLNMSAGLSALTLTPTAGGTATVDLPLYFPTSTLPLGGSTSDLNSDGFADNVLHVEASFDATGMTQTKVITPNLAANFGIISIINNPTLVINSVKTGLNGLFDKIDDGLESGVFNAKIPLVGDKLKSELGFANGNSFVDKLKSDINAKLNAALAAINGRTTVDLIQQALFDALGPGSDGKGPGILVDRNNQRITRVQDVLVVATTDFIQFDLRLSDKLVSKVVPLDIAASIPGLDLNVNGDVKLDLGYQFEFGFGFHKTDGFYFDTTGALPSGDEFAFTLAS